jgi:murein DD-endopeptidase MepM/ murein hydrolase activator NlpD
MTDKIILKHRYFLTSEGRLRLRYIMPSLMLGFMLLWVGLIGQSNPSHAHNNEEAYEAAAIIPMQDTVDSLRQIVPFQLGSTLYDPEEAGNGIDPFLGRIGSRPEFEGSYVWEKILTVEKGDTLGTLIEQTGLSGDDYSQAMAAIKGYVDPQSIRPGHEIKLSYIRLNDKSTLQEISYVKDSLTSIVLSPNADDIWIAEKRDRPVKIKTYAAKTTINNSLFADLGAQGVPDGIINKMIQAYSWSVDFQRDIWGGEEVELLYETKETDDGSYVRSNRLKYAKLTLRDKDLPIYLFKKSDGFETFFEPDGQSIKRALLRTPVDGARLSSGFGMRKHPVLGYNKMHKGVDFAAPTGTPIYAAGDGVVERANRFGAYGNYVRVRHNNDYKTAYAHLHKFGKGIRSGTRVKQGQVIGYIGNTGRSTGPHLHYEVIKNGKQVNPHSVDLPLGEKLRGTDLANFKRTVNQVNDKYASLSAAAPKLAQADITTDQ